MAKARVLFLCTGNSARSIMAEALLRRYADDHFEAYSAGLEPKGINPYTVRIMNEIGLDVSSQRSKSLMEYLGRVHMGFVITVCDRAEANCPIFPFGTLRLHWQRLMGEKRSMVGDGRDLGTVGAALAASFFPSGASKSIPPNRMETSDSVLTLRPLVLSAKSMPLAFQKRVFDLTYWS